MSKEDIKIEIVANGVPYYIMINRLNQELMEKVSKCPICEAENKEVTRFELMEL